MSNIIVSPNFTFQPNTVREDGLVNITALSTVYRNATGKRKDVQHWLVTKEATESIAYLERVTGIPVTQLVIAEHGVGTWVHPDLAEIFAQWISVEYRFAVIQLIRVAKENKPQPPPRQLPPQRDYIEHLQAAKEIALLGDPILKSHLLQACYEEIGAIKALSPSEDVLVIAAVKARSLGFTLKPGEDTKLGKWVAMHCNPLGKTQHGRYEVNVYRDDDRLVEAISTFFQR